MSRNEYKKISEKEIKKTIESDPMRATLMFVANDVLEGAYEQSKGIKKREPSYHKSGWNIALHSGKKESAIGLWSCWLDNQFFLGYPKGINVPDETVMKILDVEYGKHVLHVSATGVGSKDYNGEYKDADKSLETNEAGQIVAYKKMGSRVWATFMGKKEEQGGRVWINKSARNSDCYPMSLIEDTNEFAEVYFGHDYSNGISTYPFNFFNKYSPESPTIDKEAVQKYKKRFLELAVETAFWAGEPSKITINYGFAMVPEDLEREGYKNIKWLKGIKGKREGRGNELVRAEDKGEIIMLKSGNSIVPWSTIRQLDIPRELRNKKGLVEFIETSLTF